MHQSNIAAGNLPSLIAALFILGLSGTLGQGQCRGDEDKGSTTFSVRYIGPDAARVAALLHAKPKAEIVCRLDCYRRGFDKTKVDGVDITGRDQDIYINKNRDKAEAYAREVSRSFTVSDPKKVVSQLHLDIWLFGRFSASTPAEVDDNFVITVPPTGSEITIKYDVVTEYKDGLFNSGRIKHLSTIQCLTVLDKQLKYVEVKESPPIRAAKDSPQVKKEDYTVKHSVGVQEGYRVEGDLRANLAIVELGIKGAIERSTNKTFEESKTTTRVVTIPGNGKPYKVVWVETFRTGKAITIINGKKYEVPFEFREGWDLQTKEVNE